MRYVTYAAAAFAAPRLFQPALRFLRLRHTSFLGRPVTEPADPATFPDMLAPIFGEASRELESLGFEPSHAQWTGAIVEGEPRQPAGVFVHRASRTFAEVTPPIFDNGRRLYAVAFTTFFRSGHPLVTVDSLLHLTPLRPTDREVHDHELNDVVTQWSAHEHAAIARSATDEPAPLSAQAYMRAQSDSSAATVVQARRDNVLETDGKGGHRLTAAAAWRATKIIVAAEARIRKADRMRLVDAASADEAWTAADIYAFTHAESRRPPAISGRTRIRVFVAGLALSAIALGTIIGWALVPGLLFLLLLHELGHVAGMRLFGYRDRQILFVPLVGAAALGRKDDATPAQRLTVLLLGPVPGILLGMVALQVAAATGSAWLHELGLMAIVLNYLNLLPFAPLDGGRIVDVLLLHRFPRAGVAFLLTSSVVAGLAGLATGDPLLVLVSIAVVSVLPGRWLVGDAAASAMRMLPRRHTPRPDRIRAAFRALDMRPRPVAAGARVAFARAVMEHLDAPSPRTPLAIAGAVLYGTLLVAPVVGTTMMLLPDPTVADLCVFATGRQVHELAPEFGSALVEVCADPAFPALNGYAQWKQLIDRGGHLLAAGDSTIAVQYYRLAHNAAVLEFGDGDVRRVATRKLVQELAAAEAARAAHVLSTSSEEGPASDASR